MGQDRELQGVVANARVLLGELLAEGVEGFERVGLPEAAPVEPAPAAAVDPEPAAPAIAREEPGPPARPAPAVAPPAPAPLLDAPADFGAQPTLESVREALGDCQRCGLCAGRTNIVFGDGNPDANLLFVGEGPGQNEDLQGLPFVGRAGELLTQMIEKGIGIPRSDVYICNIVKCRPPNNRNPLPPEVTACRPFLDGQIDAVRPKVIVSLGKPAASLLLGREVAITRIRGKWHDYRGIPLMPTLHPAFVLRQYTPENRRAVWEDLKAALARSLES